MAAIAGIMKPDATETVQAMLDRMAYRGAKGCAVRTVQGLTLGVRWTPEQESAETALLEHSRAEDAVSDSHFARAEVKNGVFILTRDPLGVSPLYYGFTSKHEMYFASEVKALLGVVPAVHEAPPGSALDANGSQRYFELSSQAPLGAGRLEIAAELRRRLARAVEKRASSGREYGAWLSGGLDSSTMVALWQQAAGKRIHTFAAGFQDAPDLEYAQIAATHLRTRHHEIIPSLKDAITAIPDVIYHLESFDPYLVRSSLMNYFVAKLAADYVPAVLSGEGGDELFAGYAYLNSLSLEDLPSELIDITGCLHNTALQRVDRCSAAFGTVAYVPFLDQEVVEYALRIPPEYKIYNGYTKWILRRAVYDLLPERIFNRKKEKFWEGALVQDQIAQVAKEKVSDAEFARLQALPDGSSLRTKEEAYYYRIFQEFFGKLENLDWMGRTKEPTLSRKT